jgi:hypothetical protein
VKVCFGTSILLVIDEGVGVVLKQKSKTETG